MRTHNTNETAEELQSYMIDCDTYPQHSQRIKPSGFWYAINDEWRSWCETEMPEWVKRFNHEVVVDSDSILTLVTLEDKVAFMEKYTTGDGILSLINWQKVAKDYKGIEIQNFWEDREYISFGEMIGSKLATMWYYALDCSCGCIWDYSAIKHILPKKELI